MNQVHTSQNSDYPSRDRLAAWITLSRCRGIGPVLLKRAIEALGSPERILSASAHELSAIEGIGDQRAAAILHSAQSHDGSTVLTECQTRNVLVLCPDHPDWPPGLCHIPDPPVVLYLRGLIQRHDTLAVGIVGARRCTLYGREQAGRFASDLAQAGMTIVSGGARGIDTSAHHGALRAGGRTLVVQGCGLNFCYPDENAELYDRIVREDCGAIISELPLDQPPLPENFPPRNRIIAALTLGILVVEANLRSGSLITARLAADDYGREVFAIPGRVDSAASSGVHHLIKTGSAALVENAEDILTALGQSKLVSPSPKTATESARTTTSEAPDRSAASGNVTDVSKKSGQAAEIPMDLTGPQKKLLEACSGSPHDVDELCEISGLPASVVVSELTFLQIKGMIKRAGDQRF
jgi:DNA processing protein